MGAGKLGRELAVMAMLAVVLALLAPYDTGGVAIGRRLILWGLFAIGGYACFRPVVAGGDALSAASGTPRWLALSSACALSAFPTTLLVAVATAGGRVVGLTLGDLLRQYPGVVLIGLLATAVQVLLAERRATREAIAPEAGPEPDPLPAASEAPAPPPASPAFLDRLPATIGRDLLALENEDHYVRAYTAAGSALILIRLRDAVAGLDGIDGARVHRSWWVARAAVAEVVRRDRAVGLRLVNGLDVPVARNEAPALKAAGWW